MTSRILFGITTAEPFVDVKTNQPPSKSSCMKSTKIMLAFLGTLMLTWMALSVLVFLCSGDMSFREASTHGGVAMIMLVFGWIPSLVVSMDLEESLVKR